ncbi:MAG: HD domain-containing protein [Vampirovibrionia bacterium]
MNVEQLLDKLRELIGENTFLSIKNAFLMAENAHKKQFNHCGEPYICHPLRLCIILADELNINDSNSISIALLHDVVEKTDTTIEDIKALFGDKIAEGVALLTKSDHYEGDIDKQKQYFVLLKKASKKIQMIKLADRLDKLRDIETCDDEIIKRKFIMDTSYNYLSWAKEIRPYIAAEYEDLIFKYRDKLGDYTL